MLFLDFYSGCTTILEEIIAILQPAKSVSPDLKNHKKYLQFYKNYKKAVTQMTPSV